MTIQDSSGLEKVNVLEQWFSTFSDPNPDKFILFVFCPTNFIVLWPNVPVNDFSSVFLLRNT
jgi:hypothetical protein